MFAKRFRRPLTNRPSIVLEQLEERIVLDASGDAGAQDNPEQDQSESDENPEASQDGSATVDGDTTESSDPVADILSTDLNVVLISNALDEIQALSDAVVDEAQVIVYDSSESDLGSIADLLQELVDTYGGKIDHLAILSHGDVGVLQLTANEQISAVDILSDASSWETLGALLADGAVIDLYGCDIAQGTSGELLVSALSYVTGATVRASDDGTGTGSEADWQLEVTSAEGDFDYLIDTALLDDADILLAVPDTASTIDASTTEEAFTIITITATDADAPDGLGVADYEFVLVSDTESGSVITTANGAVVELLGTAVWDPATGVYSQEVKYTPADDYYNDPADEDTWDTFTYRFCITPESPVYEQQTVIMESAGSESYEVFDAQLADFDSDGDLDIFVLVEVGPNFFLMEWYENTGDDGSNWDRHSIALESYYLEDGDISLADMDGDGDLDVVMPLFNLCNGGVGDDYYEPVWFENRIDEYPTTDSGWERHEDGTRITRYSVHAADIDSDGDTDIVTAEGGSLTWWERTDLGGYAGWEWTEHTIETGSVRYGSVTTADVDGDGDTDIVAADEINDAIVWWEQDAGGSFVKHVLTTGFDGACSVYVTDLDGDGDVDILGAAKNDDEIAWWEHTATGWTEHTLPGSFDGASSVTAQDMDRDGDLDVIATAENSDEVGWWEQTDTGWVQHEIDSDLANAGWVAVDDIDHDGIMEVIAAGATDADGQDLVVMYSYTDNWASTPDYSIEQTLIADVYHAECAHCADVDGDGDLDIIAGYEDSNTLYVVWYENTGGDVSGWASHRITSYFDSFNLIGSISTGDLDGDGDLDVIVADCYGKTLKWYENRAGDGSSWSSHTVASGISWPYGATAVDMDGDGDLDITVSYSSKAADDSWQSGWWENVDGTGTSWNEVVVEETGPYGSWPCSNVCLPGDMDGDGDMDLVIGIEFSSSGEIEFWENQGDGYWAPHLVQDEVFGCDYLSLADMDNDGDLDIVGVANEGGLVAWWENDQDYDSTWTMHLIAEGLDKPGNLYVADFDLDGDLDVAALSGEEPGAATWWENVDGEGNVWTEYMVVEDLPYSSASILVAQEIAGGDLDGDGRPELVVVGEVGVYVYFSTPEPPRCDEGTVRVSVSGTDDYPTGGDDEVTTNEDVDYTFAATDFTFNDPDNQTFSGIRIESRETDGDLEYAGSDVKIGDVIADVTKLVFKPDANEYASPYATFTFKVIDSSGAYSDDTYTMTVNVSPVNDKPTGSDGEVTTDENVDYTFKMDDFTFNDVDGDTFAGISIVSQETNGDLEYSGIDVTENQSIVDVTQLVFSPDPDENGNSYATFTFRVADSNGALSVGTYTMTVIVTPVNGEPTYSGPTSATTDEDVPVEIGPFTGADGDPEVDQSLTYWLKATGDLANGDLYRTAADAAARENAIDLSGSDVEVTWGTSVWYMSDQDTYDHTSFQIYVTDDGGTANGGDNTSVDYTVNIAVESVNDAPVVTAPGEVAVNGNSSVHVTGISVFDVDLVQDPSLELSATLNVANGILTLGQTAGLTWDPGSNGTGSITITGTQDDINAAVATLTYTPDASFNGADTLQITVDDLGNSGKSGPIVVAQAVPIRVQDVIDYIRPDESGFAFPGPSGDFIPTVGSRVDLGELSSPFSPGEGLPDNLTGTEGTEYISSKSAAWPPSPPTGDNSSFQDHDNSGQQSDVPLGLNDFMALLKHWGYADDFGHIRLVFNEGMIHLFDLLIAQNETAAESEGENVTGQHGFLDLMAGGKTLVFNLDEMRLADMVLPTSVDLGFDAYSGPVQPTERATVQVFDSSDLNLVEALAG